MARAKQFQTAFNNGEVDPSVFGRTDTAQYGTAAAEVRNSVCMPQGGARKRGGYRYIDTVFNARVPARAESFEFGAPTGVDQEYVIVFIDSQILVYDSVNEDLEAVLSAPYVESQLYELDYTQSHDFMIITHPDHAPRQLVRLGDAEWILQTVSFTNIPQFTFPVVSDSDAIDDVQNITFGSSVSNGFEFTLTYNNTTSSTITYTVTGGGGIDEDASAIVTAIQSCLVGVPGVGVGNVAVLQQNTISEVGGGGGFEPDIVLTFSHIRVTFSNAAAGQSLKITSNNSSNITISSSGTGTPTPNNPENVWSDTRGWPLTVTFFENRLWFGGSLSRPSTLWASRTGLFFDFSLETPAGDVVADDFIDITIDADQLDRIQALHADRNLLIFTTSKEHFVRSTPATPLDFSLGSTTRVGSARINPVNYDNVTMYATRTGNSIRDFVFEFTSDGYVSNSITALANSVIRTPGQIVVQRNSSASETDYIYLCNSDGTLAVFSGDRLNGVNAWSIFETDGVCQSVAVSNDRVFGVFSREVDGGFVTTLEVLDDAQYMDSWGSYTSDSNGNIANLSHLTGKTVQAVRGSTFLGEFPVSSTGVVELGDSNATTNVSLGISYEWRIKTLPLALQGFQGSVKWDRKKIHRVFLEVLQTLGIRVTYDRFTTRMRGRTLDFQLGTEPQLLDGFQEIFLRGYSRNTQITLTQSEPYPVTLLSLGIEVDT